MCRFLARYLVLLVVASLWLSGSTTCADPPPRDAICEAITAAMDKHDVPGASLAVIDGYSVVFAEGFGRRSASADEQVTTDTLFQAASISKPVAASATLTLVENGKFDLEGKANYLLKSWQLPDGNWTGEHPVRLKHLLSHTAGLTVHGFEGYAVLVRRPTLVEILDGKAPANSPPIRPTLKPGYAFRYSGGGYCVLQQVLDDATGVPFPRLMREQVLDPLRMAHSTYEQPLPEMLRDSAAIGHRAKKSVIVGGWHVHPEMAAAGLWTTPGDLALWAIDLAKSHAGKGGTLLSQSMAQRMLTVEKGTYGLGLAVKGKERSLSFSHGGANVGYRCLLVAYPATGQGLVIMTNSDTGSAMFNDLVKLVGELYAWPKDIVANTR
jgi:CubicO group peptidase (beta-lactamase class C family)